MFDISNITAPAGYKTPSSIVRSIYGDTVSDEFIYELLINCTAFPFASTETLVEQVVEVHQKTNGSTDLDIAINWACAELDREWAAYKLTDEYKKDHLAR